MKTPITKSFPFSLLKIIIFPSGSTKKDFQEIHSFADQQHTSNRVVTSIEWSPNVLFSYLEVNAICLGA